MPETASTRLGLDDDAIFAIDQAKEPHLSPAERTACAFAQKLTVDPALIDDDDFAGLKNFYTDTEIAELIHHVNNDVFLNLLSETAALPLDAASSEAVTPR